MPRERSSAGGARAYRVIGIDTAGRVVIDLPSKSEHAANLAARFLAETHPELTFSVAPVLQAPVG